MNFWQFANEHPVVLLLIVIVVAITVESVVRLITK